MEEKLLKLIKKIEKKLMKEGIEIDEVKSGEIGYRETAAMVDLNNEKSLCRITAFHSGRLYIQILDIITEDTIFFYDDYYTDYDTWESFILDNIKKML